MLCINSAPMGAAIAPALGDAGS